MKKYLIPGLLFTGLVLYAVNATAQVKGEGILKSYYSVKDALVSGDVSAASAGAAGMAREISRFDLKTLSADMQKTVQPYFTAMSEDAGFISASGDISDQRVRFASLSEVMIKLARTVKMNAAPVYIDYCPMKKSSWLSAEESIKNPYYGKAMLSCGKITETIE